jgi:hypothetical protein
MLRAPVGSLFQKFGFFMDCPRMSQLQISTYMSYDTTDSKFRAFLNQTTTIPNYLLLSPLEPLAMTINDQWFETNFSQSEAKEYRYSKQEKKNPCFTKRYENILYSIPVIAGNF